jgi:hypothetical protein
MQSPKQQPQGVCHIVALPIYIKGILKGKRRIMKTQIFHHKKYNLQKIP